MVMRPLISYVSACHRHPFVCPPVCSCPPLSYLKGLLLVQTFFFLPRVMTHPLCFNLLLSLPVPCFVSLLSLVSFRSYPCFISLLYLFSSVLIPCFPSLLCTFSYFLVFLACPILAIYSAYIKRYRFRMLSFFVLFAV